LSLGRAVRAALLGDGGQVHSLIDRFHYPRLGPGQMWEEMAAATERLGGEVRVRAPVTALEHDGERVTAVRAGDERREARAVISSLPLREAVACFDPAAPDEIRAAARGLRYRDFLTVALVVR